MNRLPETRPRRRTGFRRYSDAGAGRDLHARLLPMGRMQATESGANGRRGAHEPARHVAPLLMNRSSEDLTQQLQQRELGRVLLLSSC